VFLNEMSCVVSNLYLSSGAINYCMLDYCFGHCSSSSLFVKNLTTLRKVDLFLSSSEGRRDGCLLWWVLRQS
jgi:hypothetical protein